VVAEDRPRSTAFSEPDRRLLLLTSPDAAALEPHEQADGCEEDRQNQKDFGHAKRHAIRCSRRRVVAERLGHSAPALVMNVHGRITERMPRAATTALDRVLGASGCADSGTPSAN
jgi:hypothetical protein